MALIRCRECSKGSPEDYDGLCRKCWQRRVVRIATRRWRAENRDEIRRKEREMYANDPQYRMRYRKARRDQYRRRREKVLVKAKAYRDANLERIRAKSAVYRRENLEWIRARRKEIRQAKERGEPWERMKTGSKKFKD